MSSQLDFLAAFGFLQVKDEDRAINIQSISEIALLPNGEAAITTVAGGHYTLPAPSLLRLKKHCEEMLNRFANAQPGRIVVPGRPN